MSPGVLPASGGGVTGRGIIMCFGRATKMECLRIRWDPRFVFRDRFIVAQDVPFWHEGTNRPAQKQFHEHGTVTMNVQIHLRGGIVDLVQCVELYLPENPYPPMVGCEDSPP